ncbi:MAG TPA: hypothetical protein VF665_08750 [Longimicrobium sp.]|jgi:hypothetical protein|uniref:hypothetical protein n=1 Tax=Longimicrobium sp. TaxID=2029185 RepID=UPI002ED976E0
MADIDIERKKKSPLPWILGLLALLLLLFLLMRSCGDDDQAENTGTVVDTTTSQTVAPVAPMPATDTTAAATGAMPAAGAAAGAGWIAGVLGGQMAGQTASGQATVPSTPSDRGFWVEENGQRVFAVLQEPMEQIKDIDPGQTVRITNAKVMRGSESAQIPESVDAEAKTTASQQQYFLLVPSNGVEITAGGNTTAN